MTAKARLEWDEEKNKENIEKHGVSFYLAQYAFADPNRLIFEDLKHSQEEKQYYCVGKVEEEILTVRFTYGRKIVRIFGAGYWRKGKKIYEKHDKIHE